MTRGSQSEETLGEAEQIALLYAPQHLQPAFHALLCLDAQLARIALKTGEPALAQLKLAWWRDVFSRPGPWRGHLLLEQLSTVFPDRGGALANLVDAWEMVAIGGNEFPEGVEAVARARGIAIAFAARVELDDACLAATRRWSLSTLAAYAPSPDQGVALSERARALGTRRLSRALRTLAVLDGLSRRMLKRGGFALIGDRLSPFAIVRLGIFGR